MLKSFAYIDEKIASDIKREEMGLNLSKAELLWIDIEDPNEADIDILEDVFKFHELSIEDCIFPQNQPKIDEFDDYLFIVVHALVNSEIEGISIFVGKNYVVSVHERPIPALSELIGTIKKKEELLKNSSCFLLHSILDRIVDSFLLITERIDAEIDKAEEEAMLNPSRNAISRLFDIKKKILSLRRTILPQQSVINTIIRKPFPIIKEETIPYFKDIGDHIIQVNTTLNTYRDILTHILEVCSSNLESHLSEVLKVLTVIATLAMPFLMITSYYGMNIALPEFKWGIKGVAFVFGIAIASTLAVFIYFRKKRLL
ncbi:MAG: magnesium transporter CorA family protein [bacterium]